MKLIILWAIGCTDETFSILERIDVGETWLQEPAALLNIILSVSSNGSTWVKRVHNMHVDTTWLDFQYPRTDRRG